MALFKTDQARSGYPQCVLLHGSFVVPASPAYNLQIVPANLAVAPPGAGAPQISNAVNPTGLRVPIFCAPNPGQALPATNIARLPAATPAGGVTPIGCEFLLDLSGFPADIVSCEIDICRQQRNLITNDVQATVIDTVNKFIILQTVIFTTGAAAVAGAGSLISFQVAFKDSLGV